MTTATNLPLGKLGLVVAVGLVLTTSACSPRQIPATQLQPSATMVADQASYTLTVPSTAGLTASATARPSVTPTDTPTVSPTSTSTPSPTVTFTPRPLPSPSPTNTPTATLPPPAVFAETPVQAFQADVFVQYLGLVRDSFRSAYRAYAHIDRPGGCGTYSGWFALWVAQAPGFTDVPPAWDALYREYRSWIHQAVGTTWQIHLNCTGGENATLTPANIEAYALFFDQAYLRSEAMLVEAESLPR